ncbi:hypothetical protein RFI_25082 [Reticulomyxa filosa]|uniref:UBP34/UBP24/USP9X/USP9Y-like ARM repeat region domain-containing protein n=1 Tax=Reticulomyxa filosa TaxID=46433 RepID=X6MF64_RETFI|nr:hypothetical protein RFI_25082 [Reticulomyxa filosa]|eukprot:ETO12296.1 hypothetical protein RFI_25082 [Reticulomyxa filosa]
MNQVATALSKLKLFFKKVYPRRDLMVKCENLQLIIALKCVQCDSLPKKISGMKDFKDLIDAVNKKKNRSKKKATPNKGKATNYVNGNDIGDEAVIDLADSGNSNDSGNETLCVQELDEGLLIKFIETKKVLYEALAPDAHEDIIKRTLDIFLFLAAQSKLNYEYIDLLWRHALRGNTFADTTYKVLYELCPVIPLSIVEYILKKVDTIPVNRYNLPVIQLILGLSRRCLRFQSSSQMSAVMEKHLCGLSFFWKAIEERDPITEDPRAILEMTQAQAEAITQLINCLQFESGCSYQEMFREFCVQKLHSGKSVANALTLLMMLIQIHPSCSSTGGAPFVEEGKCDNIVDEKEDPMQTQIAIPKQSREEILEKLVNNDNIMGLLFHNLTTFMNEIRSKVDDMPLDNGSDVTMAETKHLNTTTTKELTSAILSARERATFDSFKAQLDFFRFLLQNSTVQLNYDQIETLWQMVIGSQLDSEQIPPLCKLIHSYFFDWLKEICPSEKRMNSTTPQPMSLEDASHVNNHDTSALECLHRYFELTYSLFMNKASEPGLGEPIPINVIDVMWDISIMAKDGQVAERCGVLVTTFYMKPIPSSLNIPFLFGSTNHQLVQTLERLIQQVGSTSNTGSSNLELKLSSPRQWSERYHFVKKCIDCMQLQNPDDPSSFKILIRCFDLLETFVECTRPGTMSAVIDETDENANQWDLGKFSINKWELPMGRNIFVHVDLTFSNLSNNRKVFKLIISNRSTVDELIELVAAVIKVPKGLFQLTTDQNLDLTRANMMSTLEAIGISLSCNLNAISFINPSGGDVPDGASILMESDGFFELLFGLLKHGGALAARVWNLLVE